MEESKIEPCLICSSSKLITNSESNCDCQNLPTDKGPVDSNVEFVLRHVLELPSEQLKLVKRHCAAHPQGEWLRICDKCGANYVAKCKMIFSELMEVRKRFEEARVEMMQVIKRSVDAEGDGLVGGVGGGDKDQFSLDIILRKIGDFVRRRKDKYYEDFGLMTSDLEPNILQGQSQADLDQEGDTEIKVEVDIQPEHDEHKCASREEVDLPSSSASASHEDVKPEVILPHGDQDDDFDVGGSPDHEEDSDDTISDDDESPTKNKLNSTESPFSKPYPCDQCAQILTTAVKLRRHQMRIHKTNFHVCPQCPWKTNKAYLLADHIKRHHGTSLDLTDLTCPTCHKILSSRESLRKHVSKCDTTKRKLFYCTHCHTTFPTKITYLNHLEIAHNDKTQPKFTCDFEGCDKSYFKKYQLVEHQDIHKDPQYKCAICGERFKRKYSLSRHERKHKGYKFQCELCPDSFSAEFSLKRHRLKVHNDKQSESDVPGDKKWRPLKYRKHLKCSHCGLSFWKKTEFDQHVEKMHPGVAGVKVQVEPEVTEEARVRKLRRHKTGEEQKRPYGCVLCPARYDRKGKLEIHMSKVHGGGGGTGGNGGKRKRTVKYLKCPDCTLGFAYRKDLDKHLKEAHGSECSATSDLISQLRTTCDLCGRIMSTSWALRVHKFKVHKIGNVKVGKYSCTMKGCGKSFDTKGLLESHVLIKHEGRSPFQCESCGKGFSTVGHLSRHRKAVHTEKESKPIQCEECGVGFPVKEYLWHHKKSHHKNNCKNKPT